MDTRIQTPERLATSTPLLERLWASIRRIFRPKSRTKEEANADGNPWVYDQMEENVSAIIGEHQFAYFLAQIEKYQEEYAAAEARAELTDADFEAIEEAKAADRRQQKRLRLRNLLKDVARYSSPNSEVCKKAIEALELLDRIEAGESRLWAQLDTLVFTVMEMCRTEDQKRKELAEEPAQKGEEVRSLFKKIVGWIFKRMSHFICAVVVSVIATIIAAIIVDILADFGWIENIKGFICRIVVGR